jgi:hypothetical protein
MKKKYVIEIIHYNEYYKSFDFGLIHKERLPLVFDTFELAEMYLKTDQAIGLSGYMYAIKEIFIYTHEAEP